MTNEGSFLGAAFLNKLWNKQTNKLVVDVCGRDTPPPSPHLKWPGYAPAHLRGNSSSGVMWEGGMWSAYLSILPPLARMFVDESGRVADQHEVQSPLTIFRGSGRIIARLLGRDWEGWVRRRGCVRTECGRKEGRDEKTGGREKTRMRDREEKKRE